MYSISVIVGSTAWALMYKTPEHAEEARTALRALWDQPVITMGGVPPTSSILVTDDFGQELAVDAKSLCGWLFEDMDQSKLAHCERILHQQRLQIHAQKMGQADQTIRTAQMMNGPAMIDPIGGRRM